MTPEAPLIMMGQLRCYSISIVCRHDTRGLGRIWQAHAQSVTGAECLQVL